MPVMTHTQLAARSFRGLDDDEIDARRQPREPRTVRQAATLEQPTDSNPEPPALPKVDRFLGQPEVTAGPPADLDRNQLARRTRIDRKNVDLASPDVDVPPDDLPARELQRTRSKPLGAIACLLGTSARPLRRGGCHAPDDRHGRLPGDPP
jgi:hypothetical protein